jgi:hypothetical protein
MRALFALFIRSVRDDVRARLPVILRASLVLIILLCVWANQRDFARRAAPGREFLLIVVMVNLSFIAVAALGGFASAITEEKEDETLPLLRMTNLSPLAILLGKSTSRLLGAALLLAVQIPFTILAVTLGGVSLDQVLGSYAILATTTFFLCNLALLGSVLCRTNIRAGMFTGISSGILYAILPWIAVWTALQRMRPGSLSPQTAWEHVATWVVEANPVYAFALLVERRGGLPVVADQAWPHFIGGVLCFLLAWLLFNPFCAVPAEARAKRGGRLFGVLLLRGGLRRRPSPRLAVVWKDFHFLIGGWRGMCIRCALCGLLFLGIWLFARMDSPGSEWMWRNIGEMTMVFSAMLFGLELTLVASRIFGVERRMLTLSGLTGLPRKTGWLIWSKVAGCLPALLPSAALFAIGFVIYIESYAILGISGDRRWDLSEQEIIILAYVVSQILLGAVLIALLSLRMRRGALPAGIAAMTVWNILVGVVVDSVGRGDEEALILAFTVVCLIAVVVAGIIIPQSLRAAAAEG